MRSSFAVKDISDVLENVEKCITQLLVDNLILYNVEILKKQVSQVKQVHAQVSVGYLSVAGCFSYTVRFILTL